jgi:hypothetical protein
MLLELEKLISHFTRYMQKNMKKCNYESKLFVYYPQEITETNVKINKIEENSKPPSFLMF